MANSDDKELSRWKWIDVMELVYAILMTWGFAKISLEGKFSWDYFLCLIIAAFVLIRFFFVPSHDLEVIAEITKARPIAQRFLFIFDVPVAIAHSFLYCRMCILIINNNMLLGDKCGRFYEYFSWLLLLNVIWLVTIFARECWFEKKMGHLRFLYWAINNLLHFAIFKVVFNFADTSHAILFFIAFSNCLWDFVLTAPKYLNFNNNRFKFRYKLGIFLLCYLLPMIIALLVLNAHFGLF